MYSDDSLKEDQEFVGQAGWKGCTEHESLKSTKPVTSLEIVAASVISAVLCPENDFRSDFECFGSILFRKCTENQ